MHTHLKGRIFSSGGTSFLVLHEDDESSDWIRVRTVGPNRELKRMKKQEVESLLALSKLRRGNS